MSTMCSGRRIETSREKGCERKRKEEICEDGKDSMRKFGRQGLTGMIRPPLPHAWSSEGKQEMTLWAMIVVFLITAHIEGQAMGKECVRWAMRSARICSSLRVCVQGVQDRCRAGQAVAPTCAARWVRIDAKILASSCYLNCMGNAGSLMR